MTDKSYSAYEVAVEALNQASKVVVPDYAGDETNTENFLAAAEKIRLWLFEKGELTPEARPEQERYSYFIDEYQKEDGSFDDETWFFRYDRVTGESSYVKSYAAYQGRLRADSHDTEDEFRKDWGNLTPIASSKVPVEFR